MISGCFHTALFSSLVTFQNISCHEVIDLACNDITVVMLEEFFTQTTGCYRMKNYDLK